MHSKFPWTNYPHTPTAVFDGDGRRIIDQWVAPATTEEMAKCLWRAERLYLNLTQDERTPFSWENGVSYKDQDRWRYIAEHAISISTPLDPETAAANAVMIAGLPGLIEALKVARDLIRNAMEYGYEPDIAYDCGIAQVDAALASIGRTL